MPSSSAKNERRLTGYRGDTTTNNNVGQIQHHSLYDDDMNNYHSVGDEDNYDEYDEDLDDGHDEDDRDDTGSELSIPDPNIDFNLVYALHTFTATVEGQASVVRGDALTLLDDSNSYWWLVKVLKSAEVGYIPAENIETPHERLARLNSHRNIELTKRDIQDNFPKPPSNNSKKKKRVTLAKGVQFQSQIVYGSTDDESDYEAEFEQWNERMRSDDSEDGYSDNDETDPYQYYEDPQNVYYADQQTVDMYSSSYNTEQHTMTFDMHNSHSSNRTSVNYRYNNNATIVPDDEPIDYYNDGHLSGDSDIINDPEDPMVSNRDTLNLEDETIKISLTPSIARGYGDSSRHSDGNIQSKLKKAAKLEKLLGGGSSPSPEPDIAQRSNKEKDTKKEKSGIRKFFSRSSSGSSTKESKKSKKNSDVSIERQTSNSSSIHHDTGSVSSASMLSYEQQRERSGSQDSTQSLLQPTQIKVFPGNLTDEFNGASYRDASVYPSTTSLEVIQQLLQLDEQQLLNDYQEYHIVIKTIHGDEFTLVPSDKPLEMFQSLTAHLNTPMPSLKKARRISQLMGSESTHIGGPKKDGPITSEDQVQFYLYSKTTRRVEEGEIQIKVSLLSSDSTTHHRVDKFVKLPSSMAIKDVTSVLLEKFHILNGVVAGSMDDATSLRLSKDDLVRYGLAVHRLGQERLLNVDEKLLDVFGDEDVPPIHYRRNSNPDRSSMTVNIAPPEQDETYFLLKRMESPIDQPQSDQVQRSRKLVRQDTPMPQQESTPTQGFETPEMPNVGREEITASPETEDVLTPLDEPKVQQAPVKSSKRIRPESVESMLFVNDFGMNDLMVIIRGAAQTEKIKSKVTHGRHTSYTIRSEISEVFKDSQARLDQLEKELDRIMIESLKVYPH